VASGATSVIAGGQNNTASGELSVISGGSGSTASGRGSVVGGGDNNTASGQFATIPGGQNNVASGNYSFAVGRRARATHPGSVVVGDSTDVDKNSSGDNQFFISAAGGVGINVAPAAGSALTVSGKLKAGSAEFDSMNVANLSATSVSGFGTVPLGGIILWSGAENAVPAGWALCNGQSLNGRTTPNLRGRFVIGASDARGVGTTGGAESVTLSINQIPAHNHRVKGDTWQAGSHSHQLPWNAPDDGNGCCQNQDSQNTGLWGDSGTTRWGRNSNDAGNHSHYFDVTSDSTGGVNGVAQAVGIMPPFYALAYIMRVQ
jgi:microcystin-dependent protein